MTLFHYIICFSTHAFECVFGFVRMNVYVCVCENISYSCTHKNRNTCACSSDVFWLAYLRASHNDCSNLIRIIMIDIWQLRISVSFVYFKYQFTLLIHFLILRFVLLFFLAVNHYKNKNKKQEKKLDSFVGAQCVVSKYLCMCMYLT